MDNSDNNIPLNLSAVAEEQRKILMEDEHSDPLLRTAQAYQLWWHWADFHLFIISPTIDMLSSPLKITAEHLGQNSAYEFVYTIYDYGYKLSTSKAEDMFTGGMSNCKLNFTIEKIVAILVERLKMLDISPETEVQVAFDGHEFAQRKAFESIINLNYNVVVTNFDPGTWGDRYLQNVKRLADKGYGYPAESPRTIYRHHHGGQTVSSSL
ncbi:MAG: virulence factor [Legionella sp.]